MLLIKNTVSREGGGYDVVHTRWWLAKHSALWFFFSVITTCDRGACVSNIFVT